MKRNAELFEKIAAQIEETPDSYDQSYWAQWIMSDGERRMTLDTCVEMEQSCGTAFCIAGWAIQLTDGTEATQWDGWSGWRIVPREQRPNPDGKGMWRDRAAAILGLHEDEAETLFDGCWGDDLCSVGEVAEALRRIGRDEADPEDFVSGMGCLCGE